MPDRIRATRQRRQPTRPRLAASSDTGYRNWSSSRGAHHQPEAAGCRRTGTTVPPSNPPRLGEPGAAPAWWHTRPELNGFNGSTPTLPCPSHRARRKVSLCVLAQGKAAALRNRTAASPAERLPDRFPPAVSGVQSGRSVSDGRAAGQPRTPQRHYCFVCRRTSAVMPNLVLRGRPFADCCWP